jgi:hypothetical protein
MTQSSQPIEKEGIKEMKNAFSRIVSTCALLLAGSAMFAATINPVTVALPYAVTVGSTTLPSGEYELTSFAMGGEQFFVVRGDHTPIVTLRGERVEDESGKTRMTLSKDGDQWHFDKLTVAGEGEAFVFTNAK